MDKRWSSDASNCEGGLLEHQITFDANNKKDNIIWNFREITLDQAKLSALATWSYKAATFIRLLFQITLLLKLETLSQKKLVWLFKEVKSCTAALKNQRFNNQFLGNIFWTTTRRIFSGPSQMRISMMMDLPHRIAIWIVPVDPSTHVLAPEKNSWQIKPYYDRSARPNVFHIHKYHWTWKYTRGICNIFICCTHVHQE